VKEAKRVGSVNVTGSTKADNYNRIPRPAEIRLTPGAAYVHITTNNTIEGTEWKEPPSTGDVPLVADASSNIFSRPMDFRRFGLVYAGAQKNLGPSGLTLVLVREDLLNRSSANLPAMLNYKVQAENHSLYNTPPDIRDLPARADDAVAEVAWRPFRNRGRQRPKSGEAVRRDRSDRLLSRHCSEGQPVAHERHIQAVDRGSGKGLREGGDRPVASTA
jgi:hypothetical protein